MILEVLKKQPLSSKIGVFYQSVELDQISSWGKDSDGYFAEVYTQPCNDIERLTITRQSLLTIMKERNYNARRNQKSNPRIH